MLLVVDAMTGQDAVRAASEFNEKVGITGLIMTKMDGDTRGGAALSVREVTGVPIKFMGTGEKPDALEPFYPDRLASRILGMGDVLTLIEKAQEEYDAEQAKAMEKKLRTATFDLEDFLSQLQQVKKLGPLEQVLGMIPGMRPGDAPAAGERRRGRPEADRGHHPLDDARRAPQPGDHRQQPPPAHRQRQRHHHAGRERAPQPVQADAEDDEDANGRGRANTKGWAKASCA